MPVGPAFDTPDPTARLSAVTTQVRPQLRRRLAFVGALVALAVPVLSACDSFDYATDRPNVIANGGYDLQSQVRVNAARIVADKQGSGVFIATFILNPTVNAATNGGQNPSFTGIASAKDSEQTVTANGTVDVPVGSSGSVNLADPTVGGIPVTGDFVPGDVVALTLQFSEGGPITVQVPVVTKCGPYADVVAQGAKGKASPPALNTDTTNDPYSCNYPKAALPSE